MALANKKVTGKQKAQFSEVYTQYYPLILSSVYSKVGSVDTAEDLTHEIFLQYLSNMDKVEKVRPWLFTVLKGVLYEYYRKERKMSDDVALAESGDDIALKYVNGFRDTRIIINGAIEQLDDETDRLIFDLVAIQKFTFEAAGEQLGLTRYNLRYRYRSIVKTIMDYLNKQGITDIKDLL
ncbi:MAG: sigma-70 family RNA polymerase sigma factor [bacterium]|nr:sigma-70 family RNA polymerase sigma factor [bacterium]